jgi:nucleoside-diphosphate-sugar epimerase
LNSILITGATGFVASHLIPYLDKQDWQIMAATRGSCPSNQFSSSVIPATIKDINGDTNWQKTLNNIDTVIHLAARAHILQEEALNPEAEFLRVNTEGTANLVKQSIQAGVKHFIFISSIGAMTTLSNHPLTENTPCYPDTSYGQSKIKAEQALISLANDSSMTWTILRPCLVYGSGNPGNMERLVKLLRIGLPLPFKRVNNRRSFLYVGNLADAIATCLTHPNARNQTFLVSDGQDLSTPELLRKIAHHLEKPCYLLPIPPSLLRIAGRVGDAIEQSTKRPLPLNTSTIDRLLGSLFVDSSYIRRTLNWQPPYTIDEGLSKTLH